MKRSITVECGVRTVKRVSMRSFGVKCGFCVRFVFIKSREDQCGDSRGSERLVIVRVPGSRSPSRDTAQVLHPLGLAHHDQEDDDDGDGHDGTIGGNEEDDKDDCVPHFRDTVQGLPTPPHTWYYRAARIVAALQPGCEEMERE